MYCVTFIACKEQTAPQPQRSQTLAGSLPTLQPRRRHIRSLSNIESRVLLSRHAVEWQAPKGNHQSSWRTQGNMPTLQSSKVATHLRRRSEMKITSGVVFRLASQQHKHRLTPAEELAPPDDFVPLFMVTTNSCPSQWNVLRRIIRKNVFKHGKVAIRTNDIVVINPLSAGLFQTKLHDSSNDLPVPVCDNCC